MGTRKSDARSRRRALGTNAARRAGCCAGRKTCTASCQHPCTLKFQDLEAAGPEASKARERALTSCASAGGAHAAAGDICSAALYAGHRVSAGSPARAVSPRRLMMGAAALSGRAKPFKPPSIRTGWAPLRRAEQGGSPACALPAPPPCRRSHTGPWQTGASPAGLNALPTPSFAE